MDPEQGAAPQRREHRRHPLLAVVRWHNRHEESVPAEICDASAGGIFLVPQGEFPSGIEPGEHVRIVVSRPEGEVTLTGAVRWQGYHSSHESLGFGVKLDRSSLKHVQSLFPVVVDNKPAEAPAQPAAGTGSTSGTGGR